MNQQQVFEMLVAFFRDEVDDANLNELRPSTNLVAAGLLDSLTLLKLLTKIQEVRGERIDLEQVSREAFESAENIYNSFFSAAPEVVAN